MHGILGSSALACKSARLESEQTAKIAGLGPDSEVAEVGSIFYRDNLARFGQVHQ
jgi:hypothetical protein